MKNSSLILSTKSINRIPLFSGLNANCIDQLIRDAVYRYIETETEILRQGELAEGLFVVLQGSVSVSIIQTNGNQSNLIRAGQGEVLGDLECIMRRPCLATAVAEPGCALVMWPAPIVARFLDNPTIAHNVIGLSYDRLAVINQVRTIEHKAHVDQKIFACLLRMATTDHEIKHSQSYVAEAVGCSRQTVNRVLGKLRDDGIVELRKSVIKITSTERLRKLVG